ncbi:MAG TPA: 2-amino-4-hydroxy-6-hydroxymethyldihydropteridine diphosphokinase [Candidatus Nanopelagicaceae bacterium]
MRAVVALGANLDDPRESVDLAVAMLRAATDLVAVSTFHVTKPVGGPPQPDYINAVCIIESELSPRELLGLLHGIEKSMGRVRDEHWGPRTIDLDLISFGEVVISEEGLVLPHPRAHERRFVLEPWMEIDPDALLISHGPIRDILAQLPAAE